MLSLLTNENGFGSRCAELERSIFMTPNNLTLISALCLSALLNITNVNAGEVTNSIGITMVDVPAGSFVMGSYKRAELTSVQKDENNKRALISSM